MKTFGDFSTKIKIKTLFHLEMASRFFLQKHEMVFNRECAYEFKGK
jgi:hypothetical protein